MPTVIDGTTGVSQVQDGVIVEADLANNAVTTAKLNDAAVTSAKMATAVQPIGVGQTWQNMFASRAAGTTYTNTTGRPIQIVVGATSTVQFVIFEMEINGLSTLFGRSVFNGSSSFASITATIPHNTTYRLVTGNINTWIELR